ncbi:hypothetical protein CSUI_004371, partial [Cystoisospora suis]
CSRHLRTRNYCSRGTLGQPPLSEEGPLSVYYSSLYSLHLVGPIVAVNGLVSVSAFLAPSSHESQVEDSAARSGTVG